MSTHKLCFRAKIRKKCNPCKPQVYYIKVGCNGCSGVNVHAGVRYAFNFNP